MTRRKRQKVVVFGTGEEPCVTGRMIFANTNVEGELEIYLDNSRIESDRAKSLLDFISDSFDALLHIEAKGTCSHCHKDVAIHVDFEWSASLREAMRLYGPPRPPRGGA